jgi:serine/threonine protein kinase
MTTNPQKIPKIVNILNTNIIYKPQLNNQQSAELGKSTSRIANNISIPKLQKLLAQNFTNIVGPESANNKKPSGLELLGKGINGVIYKINHPDQDYICKCIDYSRENMDQLEYELSLIKKLQENETAVRYINPCLGMAITPEVVITIFPRFSATTLDQVIKTMCQPEFNTPQRVSLIKYLTYQMILGLAEIHRQGVCHRQINSGSILVEIKPGQPEQTINNSQVNNTTNSYNIWFSEADIPLRVKYTNFGFGCLNTCVPMLANLDLHQPNGPTDFHGSAMFDIWCLGLLFIKLLHDPRTKELVSPELEKFLEVVNNHMLVSLDKRKSAEYIKETLAINDKLYDDIGSDGRSETADLVDKVLSGEL